MKKISIILILFSLIVISCKKNTTKTDESNNETKQSDVVTAETTPADSIKSITTNFH